MKAKSLLETVKDTLNEYVPSFHGKKVLVAFSGGADSVCLLHCLLAIKEEYELSIYAAHVHHGLRGKEADDDERFAKKFCDLLNIPFFSEHFDVPLYAKEHKLSTEDAGRTVRYAFFERLCTENQIDYIATAHHGDDNVETVLMHFLRGSGIHGLSGIPFCDNRNIIRPLLLVDKTQILEYVKENELPFVTDNSNFTTEYLRNKIRLDFIPKIEEINPNFKHLLTQNIRLYRETDAFITEQANKAFAEMAIIKSDYITFSLNAWKTMPDILRHLLLREAIKRITDGFYAAGTQIFEAEEHILSQNGSFSVGKNISVCAYDNNIYVYRDKLPKHTETELKMNIPTEASRGTITMRFVSKRENQGNNVIYLDADKINSEAVIVRYRKNGDFFYPHGFGHKKSLQDYFIDCKIPRFLRDHTPLLVYEDNIVWVCGHRQDERFYTENQENLIQVTYTEDE